MEGGGGDWGVGRWGIGWTNQVTLPLPLSQLGLIYGLFTLTDPIPILFPILLWIPYECTVILSESDTLSESESGSVNAPLVR